ncbi:hypothetical protein BCD67_03630 [Oscillatoriales cyanobacterium USR001]|nr:hypothetical protein BCD67_03630 [Oscillatoriales cyanobacterium USR001]
MTQTIDINQVETVVITQLKKLTPAQQQQVLDFVEFLLSRQPLPEFTHPDVTSMSALEAMGDLVGCVDGGPGDLATNKEYLRGIKIK